MAVPTALLLLSDSRVPGGGHAHSGGLEAAWRAGLVTDLPSLRRFLLGRLHTAGKVTAAFAAAASRLVTATDVEPWAILDAELDARTPSAAQRHASRQLGRGLLRVAERQHPGHATIAALRAGSPSGAHHPLVFGLTAGIQ